MLPDGGLNTLVGKFAGSHIIINAIAPHKNISTPGC